jgi:hypothetical protein
VRHTPARYSRCERDEPDLRGRDDPDHERVINTRDTWGPSRYRHSR